MNRTAPLVLALALPLGACAVSATKVAPNDVAVNQCSIDDDCSGGRCVQNVCQGSGGRLTALLLAVTPPPTLVGINSFTYFIDSTKAPAHGSGGGRLDIPLDAAVSMQGTVHLDTAACAAAASAAGVTVSEPSWQRGPSDYLATEDGLLPPLVTFTPSQAAYGVSADDFIARPSPRGLDFALTLPPNDYDVYIKPAYQLAAPWSSLIDCQVPPYILLHQTVASKFTVNLPPPSKLNVNITWPLAAPYVLGAELTDEFLVNPLENWRLDLIDQSSGRVLSVSQTLAVPDTPPLPGDTSITYSVTLVYSHAYAPVDGVLEPVNVGSEVIRLSPPDYDPRFTTAPVPFTAPTLLAQLDGALVNAEGKPAPAKIVQDLPLPTPVTVQFQTLFASDWSPLPAGVTVTADEIEGVMGLSTSFTRTIQVGPDGTASLDLLPGHYRVVASPKVGCTAAGCPALAMTEWDIAAAPPSQSGKTILFTTADPVTGTALVNGQPVVGATVHAVASALTFDRNVLNVGDANVAVLPRAKSGLVDTNGSFSFEADSGVFDLRVEPDPSTGYGWFVWPALDLRTQDRALGQLDPGLPIIYRGTVTGTDEHGQSIPIPKAFIRAFAYVTRSGGVPSKSEDAVSAIEVAETYAEDESGDPGAFRLLVPKSLFRP